MKALIVNFFGGPGAGKSTVSAYIFSILKMRGISVEWIQEFAKDKFFEDCPTAFNNQAYIFGQQSYRISRCADKVDVIITDAPLLTSCVYSSGLPDSFNDAVYDIFNMYDNVNYYINRTVEYNHQGRFQTEEEAEEVNESTKNVLKKYGVKCEEIINNVVDYDRIADDICRMVANRKS